MIKELEAKIIQASESYYLGEAPIMSDQAFDHMVEELRRLKPDSDCLVQVGWGMKVYRDKVRLPGRLGSLNKIQFQDMKDNGDVYACSPKVDGMSCILQYVHGELVLAATRGDGIEGVDITTKIVRCNIPHTLPSPLDILVRGEIYINTKTFEWELSGTYDNPRNGVAGIINSKGFQNLEHVRFGAHPQGDILNCGPEVQAAVGMLPLIEIAKVHMEDFRESCVVRGYPTDGLVIQNVEDMRAANFENIIAVKFKTEELETTVWQVTWEERRSGKMIPVVWYEPVRLYGTSCVKCSGFNYDYIKTFKIGKGSRIMITKANEIIPYITKVLAPGEFEDLALNDTYKVYGAHLFNKEHNQYRKSLVYFIAWHYNMDGFRRPELILKALGMNGDATFANFAERIDSMMVDEIIAALSREGVNSVGEGLAHRLKSQIKINNFFEQFELNGVGGVEAMKLQRYIREYCYDDHEMALKNAGVRSNVYEILLNVEIRDMIAECFNAFTKVNLWFFQEIKVLDLPKFCISGKLSFGTKEQFAKKVGVHRYQMVSFVDKTIEFLISNEKSTSKVLKAEKLGIPVYSEQEAIEKFGGE